MYCHEFVAYMIISKKKVIVHANTSDLMRYGLCVSYYAETHQFYQLIYLVAFFFH